MANELRLDLLAERVIKEMLEAAAQNEGAGRDWRARADGVRIFLQSAAAEIEKMNKPAEVPVEEEKAVEKAEPTPEV